MPISEKPQLLSLVQTHEISIGKNPASWCAFRRKAESFLKKKASIKETGQPCVIQIQSH